MSVKLDSLAPILRLWGGPCWEMTVPRCRGEREVPLFSIVLEVCEDEGLVGQIN